MRGKKEDFDPSNPLRNVETVIDDNSLSDYDNDFYEQLQNERRLLTEFGQMYGLDTQLPNEFHSEQEYDKRAPSVGFYGMRGKREYFNDDDEEETFDGEQDDGFGGKEIEIFCSSPK